LTFNGISEASLVARPFGTHDWDPDQYRGKEGIDIGE
jgi:hypothetical protein